MRILVTGAGGQLGRDLARALDGRHEAFLLDHGALDITDESGVRSAIEAATPEVIIHAAAWTDVDGCEGDPARAAQINEAGTAAVAGAAGDALVIAVGTDYVFNGQAERAYTESDEPDPLQVYGRTKLAGERAVGIASRWAVARTAWLYGPRRADGSPARNFIASILSAARDRDLDVVDDQVGSPTCTRDLAVALVSLAEAGATGIFHVVNEGSCSRFDLARAAVAAAGLDPERVRPISTADAPPRPATRPLYAPLEGAAWRAAGFDPLPEWDAALASTIDDMMEAIA